MNSETIDGLTEQLNNAMSHLKFFLQERKDSGFTDAAKTIELLAKQLFSAAGIADFTNANLVKGNHPAIDLFVEGLGGAKGVAAQVTSTANLKKLRETKEKFEAKDEFGRSLADRYDKLYVLGLMSATTDWEDCPRYCTVLDSKRILQLIVDRNNIEALHHAIHSIRSNQERSVLLNPSDDIGCLKIVLSTINRGAIKDYMDSEGFLKDMLRGVGEVLEVITAGSVNGKLVSKRIDDYHDRDIFAFLRGVLDLVHEIRAITHKHSNIHVHNTIDNISYVLNHEELARIDLLKKSVVDACNDIATKYLIGTRMKMTGTRRY